MVQLFPHDGSFWLVGLGVWIGATFPARAVARYLHDWTSYMIYTQLVVERVDLNIKRVAYPCCGVWTLSIVTFSCHN